MAQVPIGVPVCNMQRTLPLATSRTTPVKYRHPKIVIGVPVYNEEKYVEETLLSLRNQSYLDFLVVISDNASTDRTSEICEALCARDSRFVYIRQERNNGAAVNFKFLLEHTQSPYFMWIGAHDTVRGDFLERHLEFLDEHSAYSVSYSLVQWIDEEGRPTKVTDGGFGVADPHLSNLKGYLLSIGNQGECTAVNNVIRREFLKGVVLEPVIACDHVVLSHLFFKGPFYRYPEPLYVRRGFAQTPESRMERITGAPGAAPDFGALARAYIKDFWRLEAPLMIKMVYFPGLIWNLKKRFWPRWPLPRHY
jgi:glycosyltransferase involved in cell wall biosynthesis